MANNKDNSANLGGQHTDGFHNNLHKHLRADFILAKQSSKFLEIT